MSPHEPGLREALMATEFSDSSPEEILLIGVSARKHRPGYEADARRSDRRFRSVVDAVMVELERLGMPPIRRDPPAELDLWWE